MSQQTPQAAAADLLDVPGGVPAAPSADYAMVDDFGVVDVTAQALDMGAGIDCPVRLTDAAWLHCMAWDGPDLSERRRQERLRDVLWAAGDALDARRGLDRVLEFEASVTSSGGSSSITMERIGLRLLIDDGPQLYGDDADDRDEPDSADAVAVTIALPEEV